MVAYARSEPRVLSARAAHRWPARAGPAAAPHARDARGGVVAPPGSRRVPGADRAHLGSGGVLGLQPRRRGEPLDQARGHSPPELLCPPDRRDVRPATHPLHGWGGERALSRARADRRAPVVLLWNASGRRGLGGLGGRLKRKRLA